MNYWVYVHINKRKLQIKVSANDVETAKYFALGKVSNMNIQGVPEIVKVEEIADERINNSLPFGWDNIFGIK